MHGEENTFKVDMAAYGYFLKIPFVDNSFAGFPGAYSWVMIK